MIHSAQIRKKQKKQKKPCPVPEKWDFGCVMKTYRVLGTLVLVGVACMLFATPAQAGRRGDVPTTGGNGIKLVVSPL